MLNNPESHTIEGWANRASKLDSENAALRAEIDRLRGERTDDQLHTDNIELRARCETAEQERDTAVKIAKALTEPTPLTEADKQWATETVNVVDRLKQQLAERDGAVRMMHSVMSELKIEKQSLAAMTEDLSLMTKARDEWRVSCKEVEKERDTASKYIARIMKLEECIRDDQTSQPLNVLSHMGVSFVEKAVKWYQQQLATITQERDEWKRWAIHRVPTHGTCCTCQRCGLDHDSCRCDLDEVCDELDKLKQQLAINEARIKELEARP